MTPRDVAPSLPAAESCSEVERFAFMQRSLYAKRAQEN